MTKMRRLVAVGAFLALVALVSSPLLGEPESKIGGPGPSGTSAQLSRPAAPSAAPADDPVPSRFDDAGALTYQPIKGDAFFALQLQPKLPAAPARPRDYLIMVSTSAVMAGPARVAAQQLAEALVEQVGENDSVALWTANDPSATRCLTKDFLTPKAEMSHAVLVKKALQTLRDKEVPLGAVDLKNALEQTIKSFSGSADRQRILVFLGDGQSTYNPLTVADRNALAREMVQRRVAFFPVPLGLRLEPANLHGLASATGGLVLRTQIAAEKLPDVLKRFEAAFATPILYAPRFAKLPTAATVVYPATLPPLRSDSPTLVAGRLQEAGKELTFTLQGIPAGQKSETLIEGQVAVQASDLDNYFLVGLVEQWQNAKDQPALLRADRALVLAYQQTKATHQELVLSAELAVDKSDLEAAAKLYEKVRVLAPHDNEAAVGLRVIENIKNGKVTKEALADQRERGRKLAAKVEKVGGKVQLKKFDLAQLDKEEKAPAPRPVAPGKAAPAGAEREDLLQAQRDRIILEEQRLTQLADDALRQARRELTGEPQAALEVLRNAMARVTENPDLREDTRKNLTARLQTALRDSASQARVSAIKRQEEQHNIAVLDNELKRSQTQQTFQERVEAQYSVFKSQMNLARFEEKTKEAVIHGLFGIAQEARQKGQAIPVAAQAGYDITLAGFHIQKNLELKRQREEHFLSVMLSVEKSFVPFSDEPGIYFPPLATWKAIRELRKEKYEVSSLPDDEKGRKEATEIYKMLEEPIETKDFVNQMTLKDAIGLLYEKFAAKQKDLPILVDSGAFKEDAADAADPMETQVSLPAQPRKMSIATALRLMLSKVPTNNATYLIRRDFIEITTNDRMIKDKVLRVYPVGDLVIPISMMGGGIGGIGGGGFGGGGMMGMMGGGMMGMGGGMMGMRGGMMGMGGGMMGMGGGMMGMGGGMMGMMGGGMMGMGGMGMQMMGMGGMGMQMMGMGGMGMQMMGMGGGMMGMMGMGGGMMGMMGMGGGMMGMMGMGGGMFVGGSFAGGFNGSLGMMGATQAVGLIQLITRVVAPGEWFITQQPQPLAPMLFPGLGMVGALGGGQGMLGMVGAGPPPAPVAEGGPADIQQANTIEFFPPALALIVRAPSRIHTSITGGIIGGKVKRADAAAFLDRRGGEAIAKAAPGKVNPAPVQVAKAPGKVPAKQEEIDPAKVWQEALAKENVEPGLVIATADFLFEAGKFAHAAEFLKANLRQGVVVRPWVYEALATALEASGGDKDEIRRARLSAVALDPEDAQGFLQAARAMSEQKQYDRALAFCRQAALLEPNLPQAYEEALTLAELSKDAGAMEWAAGKLISQDWPTDNVVLHRSAELRLQGLAGKLQSERRGTEADRLKDALQRLNRRDLVIKLRWDCGTEPSEVEMTIKEPGGSVCSLEQKQTPGGGTLISTGVLAKEPTTTYTAAEAFAGAYEIAVRRAWGQPLGGRARLEITLHKGTPQESRRLEIVHLDQAGKVKIELKDGRRTAVATVPPPGAQPAPREATRTAKGGSAMSKLRQLAAGDLSEASMPRGGTFTPGTSAPAAPPAPSRSAQPETLFQGGLGSSASGGVNLTAQVQVSRDRRELELRMEPIFQSVGNGRPPLNLSVIPGGATQ